MEQQNMHFGRLEKVQLILNIFLFMYEKEVYNDKLLKGKEKKLVYLLNAVFSLNHL